MNLFAEATKARIRFVYNGTFTTEDLWRFPLEDLRKIKESLRPLLKDPFDSKHTENCLKFQVVSYMIKEKASPNK